MPEPIHVKPGDPRDLELLVVAVAQNLNEIKEGLRSKPRTTADTVESCEQLTRLALVCRDSLDVWLGERETIDESVVYVEQAARIAKRLIIASYLRSVQNRRL